MNPTRKRWGIWQSVTHSMGSCSSALKLFVFLKCPEATSIHTPPAARQDHGDDIVWVIDSEALATMIECPRTYRDTVSSTYRGRKHLLAACDSPHCLL